MRGSPGAMPLQPIWRGGTWERRISYPSPIPTPRSSDGRRHWNHQRDAEAKGLRPFSSISALRP